MSTIINIKSEKKEEIFNTIVTFQKENGFPPSVRELCTLVNLKSTSSVHRYLTELEMIGLIKVHKNICRGIQVL